MTRFESVFAENDGYPQISQQTADLLVSGAQGMAFLMEEQKQYIAGASKEDILPAFEQVLKDTINGNIMLEVLFCANPREHKP